MLEQPYHNPSERFVSNPTPEPGETVTVSVDVPARSGFDNLMLRTMHDGEGTWREGQSEPLANGTRWRFELACHNEVVPYRIWCDGSPGPRWLTAAGLIDHDPVDHFDFKLTTTGGTPRWVPETVWYQIFPDRFAASNADRELPSWAWRSAWGDPVATGPEAMTQIYGGDLDGIVDRLDHITALGVGGIYLNPIFPSRSNHRYDATSFDRVDELLGGDAALSRLREACTRAGLRLMTDLTPNHTGNHHQWFTAAQADADSVEAGFYHFTDHPNGYHSWLGVETLPKLDHSSDELRRRLYEGVDSVVGRFLEPPFSMDGWRIDVANMTGRLGLIDRNATVRRAIRNTFDSIDPQRWLLGEHFWDASGDVSGPGWHGVMSYTGISKPLASWLGRFAELASLSAGPGQDARDGLAVARTMDQVRASLPWQFVVGSMALLGSHDTARWRTMARSDELAKVGVGLLMSLPGSPSLLYGDEIGLTGDDAEQARTPMPWDDSTRWDGDMLAWYRSVIGLRSRSSALAHGGLRWVRVEADSLAFIRESLDERLLVVANRGPSSPLTIDAGLVGIDGDCGEPEPLVGAAETMAGAAGFAIWRL
jgi:alpha-glucosidase